MMESSVVRENKLSKHFETCGENMTDLADVAKLPVPMGWASDRRVIQAKHAVSVFICAFISVSGFCRGISTDSLLII